MDSKFKVLVVDDAEINRDFLSDILEDDYDIFLASNGQEALNMIDTTPDISLVLLDLMMPIIDGFGVLEELKKRDLMSKLPVIIITGDEDEENVKRCSLYGVVDYIRKPFDGAIVKLRIGNSIGLFENKNYLEYVVKEQTKELQESNERLRHILDQTVVLLGTVVEFRDAGSGQHIQRIKSYVKVIAEKFMNEYPEYNLTKDDVSVITRASLLHDVGKVAVPDSILLKNGRLTDEEYQIIKNHTIDGSQIVEGMEGAWEPAFLKTAYDIARYHHERYDGKGYPEGIKGEDIPISAQLVSVCDCYDALVNKRSYKDAFLPEKAYEMIMNGECGIFSPKILDCLTKVKDKFAEISQGSKEA